MKKLILSLIFASQALLPQLSLAEDAKISPLKDEAANAETQALPNKDNAVINKDVLSKDSVAKEIPTTEKEFVAAINNYSKEQIIAQLGEPARAEDVKLKDSGKVVASIWYYHNINTAEDGTYFPTTELDFIDGKVVQVVYMNNDGTEGPETGQTYDVPGGKPDM